MNIFAQRKCARALVVSLLISIVPVSCVQAETPESVLLAQLRENLDIVGTVAATAFGVWGVFAVRKTMQLRRINSTIDKGPGMWLFAPDIYKKYLDGMDYIERRDDLQKEFAELDDRIEFDGVDNEWKFKFGKGPLTRHRAMRQMATEKIAGNLEDWWGADKQGNRKDKIAQKEESFKKSFVSAEDKTDDELREKVIETIKEKLKEKLEVIGERSEFLNKFFEDKKKIVQEEINELIEQKEKLEKSDQSLVKVRQTKNSQEGERTKLTTDASNASDINIFKKYIGEAQTELESYRVELEGGRFSKAFMWFWNRGMYLVLMRKINSTLKKIEQRAAYLEILKEVTGDMVSVKEEESEVSEGKEEE